MRPQLATSPDAFNRARLLARERGTPVYVSGGEVVTERPPKTSAMVWPNGSVTWGNASGSDRRDRRRAA
ncbi:MAG: hypothetical protein JF887_10155 [Candidatus Dormibacteraeota bacterium]|uniref:Uncharacterized protein n=1 Tax=Candidatus Amunia macphersoniae TaxID=3127014 RepID=A0A934NA54_9BACT|nr:hypothetical protein [Candidatus Dormibacteraeota bacterium]